MFGVLGNSIFLENKFTASLRRLQQIHLNRCTNMYAALVFRLPSCMLLPTEIGPEVLITLGKIIEK